MTRHGKLGNAPGSDVHQTPLEVWDRVFYVADGKDVFDPCPHPFVQDALDPEFLWDPGPRGVNYVNPPFTLLEQFATKARETARMGHTGIQLVPCRSSQPYWGILAGVASRIAFWTGNGHTVDRKDPHYLPRRLRFLDANGKRQAGAPFDTALFLLSNDAIHQARFEYAFADVATVVHLARRAA